MHLLALAMTLPAAGLFVDADIPVGPAGSVQDLNVTIERWPPLPLKASVRLDLPDWVDGFEGPYAVDLPAMQERAYLEVPLRTLHARAGLIEVNVLTRVWNTTIHASVEAVPDAVTGTADVAWQPWTLNLTHSAVPQHLDAAEATVQVTLARNGTTWTTTQAATLPMSETRELPLLWGPGAYNLTVEVTGADLVTSRIQQDVVVPEPRTSGEVQGDGEVEDVPATVRLTSDTVNADAKRKRPGEDLITRYQLTDPNGGATPVEITITRGGTVVWREQRLQAAGSHEHRISWPTLPNATLTLVISTPANSVQRTFEILDVAPQASAANATLEPGRPGLVTLEVRDANHGSFPDDPGPVAGLPELRWTIYRATAVASNWTVAHAWGAGGSTGSLPLHTLAWPEHGSAGSLAVPLTLTPPPAAVPGQYRLAIDAGSTRLATGYVTVAAPPEITVEAPDVVVPGDALVARASGADLVTIRLTGPGGELAAAEGQGEAAVSLDLSVPFQSGPLQLNVTGTTGNLSSHQTRSILVLDVPPRVHSTLRIDGGPPPAALFPGVAHAVAIDLQATDDNDDPILASAALLGPLERSLALTDTLPEHLPAGNYTIRVTATSTVHAVSANHSLVVARLAGIVVDGSLGGRAPPGGYLSGNVTIRNVGNVPFDGIVLASATPVRVGSVEAAWLVLDEPLPGGSTRTITFQVKVPPDAPAGPYRPIVQVAGLLAVAP